MTAPRLRGSDLLLVGAGGAVGALLRYAIDASTAYEVFPWPTLVINVVGAFALGLLPAWGIARRSHAVTVALGPGLLGGFTTVSAWAGQVRSMAADGAVPLAALYLAVTLAAGILAAALGQRIAQQAEPEEALR